MGYTETGTLNRDLAVLSLDAAQYIDRFLGGEKENTVILKKLGKQLSEISGISDPGTKAFLHSDPATTEVFAQAAGATISDEISDIDQLAMIMKKIIGPLMQNEEISKPNAAQIKTFCLAFHRSLVAHNLSSSDEEESIFENESGFI